MKKIKMNIKNSQKINIFYNNKNILILQYKFYKQLIQKKNSNNKMYLCGLIYAKMDRILMF